MRGRLEGGSLFFLAGGYWGDFSVEVGWTIEIDATELRGVYGRSDTVLVTAAFSAPRTHLFAPAPAPTRRFAAQTGARRRC